MEITLFGDPSVKRKCLPDFQDARSTQIFVCNKLARLIKVLGTDVITNIAVELHGGSLKLKLEFKFNLI